MGLEKSQFNDKIFASIINGEIVVESEKDNPEAKMREAINPKTKEIKIKYEKHYHNLRGMITNLGFREVDNIGEFLFIEIDNIRLSMLTSLSYASRLMRLLPNVDFNSPINLVPWRMEKNNKIKEGLIIYQGKDKNDDNIRISDYFYDYSNKKFLNGIPEYGEECNTWDKDDWKIYFTQVKKFLVKFTKDNILTKVVEQSDLEGIESNDNFDNIRQELPVTPVDKETDEANKAAQLAMDDKKDLEQF